MKRQKVWILIWIFLFMFIVVQGERIVNTPQHERTPRSTHPTAEIDKHPYPPPSHPTHVIDPPYIAPEMPTNTPYRTPAPTMTPFPTYTDTP